MNQNKKSSPPIAAYILISCLVGSILFYFFFLNDYLAYQKVTEQRTVESCERYEYEFPDGFYKEEVAELKERTSFENARASRNIVEIKTFIEDFPASQFLSQALELKDELWVEQIAKYDEKIKQASAYNKKDAKSAQFFVSMLNYMKENNKNEIFVEFKPNLELKNWEEYPDNIRELLDNLYSSDGSKPVTDNIQDLKTNYSEGYTSDYENLIVNGIQRSLNSVFSDNFVVAKKKDEENENNETDLRITVDYTIKNQTEEGTFPLIWVYTRDKQFVSYLLGIDIDFKFDFVVPNSTDTYSYVEQAEPANNISDVEDIKDGYRRMTGQSFQMFVENISNKFGLSAQKEENL
jgi:hypothetical protein